jgi:hypothetical protein
VQQLQEHAEYLCTFSGESVPIDAMASFLQRIERPKDLVDACRSDAAVSHALIAIFEAHETCPHAASIVHVAQHVQEFCVKVAQALGTAGAPCSCIVLPHRSWCNATVVCPS